VPFHATALRALGAARRDPEAARVWARRSVFWRMGQPLLVAECFLPGFWTLTAGRAVPPLQPHQRTPGAR
jgi:chorismate--pyruvate lyase